MDIRKKIFEQKITKGTKIKPTKRSLSFGQNRNIIYLMLRGSPRMEILEGMRRGFDEQS
jgi:hypothetical protein